MNPLPKLFLVSASFRIRSAAFSADITRFCPRVKPSRNVLPVHRRYENNRLSRDHVRPWSLLCIGASSVSNRRLLLSLESFQRAELSGRFNRPARHATRDRFKWGKLWLSWKRKPLLRLFLTLDHRTERWRRDLTRFLHFYLVFVIDMILFPMKENSTTRHFTVSQ